MEQENRKVHVPVLPAEVIDLGKPKSPECWVDGTGGAGGHSKLIADCLSPEGKLHSIYQDPLACEHLLKVLPAHVSVHNCSYHEIPAVLQSVGTDCVDGILLDLGLSSDQLEDEERGFSFRSEGSLDMRYDPGQGQPAWEWLQYKPEKEIADSIYQYGEERFSRRIARRIVERRKANPIRTANELRELIYGCVPKPKRRDGKFRHGNVDPATRTFQALRIVVNNELGKLEKALATLPDHLNVGGRLLIISFHSLEDRLVKLAFRNDVRLNVITKKPMQASKEEIASNPRSRSAKLRVAERVC